MTQKENKTVNTDQAWHRLHARLEEDGLLPEKATDTTNRLFRLPVAGWAAAIAVLCISTLTVLFLRDHDSKANQHLLSLHNEKGSVTLVTTLEDGSVVYLADDTHLQYPEHFSPGKRMVKLQGNALFDVAGNKERPFVIETEEVHIEVIGTSFHVKSADHIPFEVSVERGEVKVTWKKTGESVHVKAGETVTLASDQLLLAQTPATGELDNLTKRIRFKDEKLGDILHVINKRSTGVTLHTTPSLENRPITVGFNDESPETIAEILSIAFNLTYEKVNDVLLISEP